MPTLETPPNPTDEIPPSAPAKFSAGRHGELDHTELVHLLDSYDDERARARFRESIYIALIVYAIVVWFLFYGVRFLPHGPRIVAIEPNHHNDKELTYLEMPKTLEKVPPKPTKIISEQNNRAQTAHPTPKPPTPQELQAMRRAGNPGANTPRPLPPTPQPQPAPQQTQPRPQQPQQQPPTPQPIQQRPPQPSPAVIPDAPRPSQSTRPNFSTPSNPGESIQQAANAAAQQHGQGGEGGLNAPHRHQGTNTGVEVLSDTLGTDFAPYIKRLLRETQNAWEPLIPEECYPPLNKTGMTMIRFTIQPNGVVSAMHLETSTRDVAIDKAAWGSITSQGQLHPLPTTFKGPNLELRIQFNIIREGSSAN